MSSKRALRRRSCKGKVRHQGQEQAFAALRSLARARGLDGAMNPYRCPFCGGWHIGHTPGRNR
jgi:hypothetical protein